MKINQQMAQQLMQMMGSQAQQYINQWNNMSDQQQQQMLAPYQQMSQQQMMQQLRSNGFNMGGMPNQKNNQNQGGWNY